MLRPLTINLSIDQAPIANAYAYADVSLSGLTGLPVGWSAIAARDGTFGPDEDRG